MRLFIAEKPSVGKVIAEALSGTPVRKKGFIECGQDRITWCFGHLLELAEPDVYTSGDIPLNASGRKKWREEDLPIIPENWIMVPKEDSAEQVELIRELAVSAEKIIHAGDPDREGQFLVDSLLEHIGNSKPVMRYRSSANDPVSVRRALEKLEDNEKFSGFARAAEGRSKADWLIGMNLSRAYTLAVRRSGNRNLVTVGRVQTPTLALVVNRDREIEGFRPVPFYTVSAEIHHAEGSFTGRWKPGEEQGGRDSEGRLVDAVTAKKLPEQLEGKDGTITAYGKEEKRQEHPLAFSLSSLTALASAMYGYGAEDVLKTCQALYETRRLISYPRSDCGWLPSSQFSDASGILDAIAKTAPVLATAVSRTDTSIRSRVWSDKRVSAHHGIIPTSLAGDADALDERQRNVYELIARAYVAQFYPVHEYLSTVVHACINGEYFTTTGKVVTERGWKEVFRNGKEKKADAGKEQQDLPAMEKGDPLSCRKIIVKERKTSPPARFTEGTLITAMVGIHRFVTDPEHRKILREEDGIGTEATRASIITELKRREYLSVNKKNIVSTDLGKKIVDSLPEIVKNPLLTALHERMLKSIEQGKGDMKSFLKQQEKLVREQVKIAGDKSVILYRCGACGSGISRRKSKKKKGQYWWGCSGYPECKQTYPDSNGLPDYKSEKQEKRS